MTEGWFRVGSIQIGRRETESDQYGRKHFVPRKLHVGHRFHYFASSGRKIADSICGDAWEYDTKRFRAALQPSLEANQKPCVRCMRKLASKRPVDPAQQVLVA